MQEASQRKANTATLRMRNSAEARRKRKGPAFKASPVPDLPVALFGSQRVLFHESIKAVVILKNIGIKAIAVRLIRHEHPLLRLASFVERRSNHAPIFDVHIAIFATLGVKHRGLNLGNVADGRRAFEHFAIRLLISVNLFRKEVTEVPETLYRLGILSHRVTPDIAGNEHRFSIGVKADRNHHLVELIVPFA